MKNRIFYLIGIIFVALSFAACSDDENLLEIDYADVTANIDDKVLDCFNLTNAFRTGSEAYYWNEDNKTKTNLVGQLSELTLDEELCRAAQIRANEIVRSFSHTRPNGNKCFTVLKDLSISYGTAAENIAAGNQSGEKTFLQWKEDDKNYAGQGHRRNMLGANYKRIGIAYAYNANSTYRYYWAMILTN
ncbi:MAG: hypothetical protein J1D88_02090 [Treponema sp.]|nr:hypothetical protein [Treponema sp.]